MDERVATDGPSQSQAASMLREVLLMLGELTSVQTVLDAVCDHVREAIHARAVAVALIEDTDWVVAAVAGERELFPFQRAPVAAGVRALAAIDAERVLRFDADREESIEPLRGRAMMVAPMIFRGRAVGALTALDHEEPGAPFRAEDEALVEALAVAAATAAVVARSATDEALRRSVAAADRERRRWAGELHDGALQNLAAVRMLLTRSRLGDADDGELVAAAETLLGEEIRNLRGLVTDLRPAALDQLGSQPAIETAAQRVREETGVTVALDIDLAYEMGRDARRHTDEIEGAIYFVVSETLTAVARTRRASWVRARVRDVGEWVEIEIEHDGGRDDDADGLLIVGMRERVALVGGRLSVEAVPSLTRVCATLPGRRRQVT